MPLPNVVRITMDLFEHHYYRLIKISLTLVGQWPFQSTSARRRILTVLAFIGLTTFVPQVLAIVKNRNDWRVVLESLLPCLFVAVCAVRFLSIIFNSQRRLKLLNCIISNWQVWSQDREVNVLHEYAEHGQKITMIYTGTIYSTVIIYMIQPIIRNIIVATVNNDTKHGKFPYPVDFYYFDAQKYYYYVIMHCCICGCVAAMPLVATDSMLIICVQHVCSVFTALGHKLEQIGKNDTSLENIADLSALINRHNDAIEYANLIEATFRWDFFIVIGVDTILFNLLGLQIIMGVNDPSTIVRFVAFALTLEFVFYGGCHISQILMDHSMSVGYNIHKSRWYRLSPRTQKVVQLMTVRCHVPCQLTAGKMFTISMRTFGLVFRSTLSFFAVFRHMSDRLNNG